MPEQIIKDTYGEIPDEFIDVEKLLEEAGLSGAGKAPHRERPKRRSEKDLIDSHDLGRSGLSSRSKIRMVDLEDRFVKLQMVKSGTGGATGAAAILNRTFDKISSSQASRRDSP